MEAGHGEGDSDGRTVDFVEWIGGHDGSSRLEQIENSGVFCARKVYTVSQVHKQANRPVNRFTNEVYK